ncbi:MAG: hypothetical protein ACRCYU_17980 [Nocardioides sp.]
MSRDPLAEEIAADLLWLRRQRGDFGTRLARALRLIDNIGGGSLRNAKNELERIRRDHAGDPDSDVTAYFASAGYRTSGDSLDQRLRVYAKRRHVVERTALRRSDRGAEAISLLLRDRLRYARPWAYLIAVQRERTLTVFVSFVVQESTTMSEASIYANGERLQVAANVRREDDTAQDRHWTTIPPLQLNPDVDEDTPLVTLTLAWVPHVAPTWELVTHFADDRIYGRFTVEPAPTVQLEVRWWDAFPASTREWPLAMGRV